MTRLFAIALLQTFAAGSALAQGVPLREAVPHVVTTGSATREVVPDQADIRLGVRKEKPTADEATQAMARAATDVIDAVEAHGVDAKDIKTSFDVSAQYDYVTDPVTHAGHQAFRNYVANEKITVRVRDITKAGALARTLIAKGANSFEGIDFGYSKEKAVRRQLDAEAIRDALAAAKTYTDAINLTLGRVLQIGGEGEPGEASPPMPIRREAPAGRAAMVIPTEPGVQTLNESVSVIWELEGKAR